MTAEKASLQGGIIDQGLAEAARAAAGLPPKPQPGCIAVEATVDSKPTTKPPEADTLMANSYPGDEQPFTD